jgi:hypothetical protein
MKKISEVINDKLFLNSYEICKKYTDKEYIHDINLKLLKNTFDSLTIKNVKSYYDKFIENELFYSVPYLFATDVIAIPKNINGLREYRFFSTMSMILYNTIGLLFEDICYESISTQKLEKYNIYRYSPTRFYKDGEKIKTNNDYAEQYKKFLKKQEDLFDIGDIILKIDISAYFENIQHEKLVKLIRKYGVDSDLAIYDFDDKAEKTLLFYFEALMNQKVGIPQGKDNCASDLLGELYLIPFDMEIQKICKKTKLNFKAMIRYVDDIYVILKNTNRTQNSQIYKELSTLEQYISSFMYNELGIKLNNKKTEYEILKDKEKRELFIAENKKKVSNIDKDIEEEKIEVSEIVKNTEELLNIINKYKFNNDETFKFEINKQEREKIKVIFDNSVINYIRKEATKNKFDKVLNSIDIELTIEEMNILIKLFFVKDKKGKSLFMNKLLDFLTQKDNICDKRFIHILLLLTTQNYDLKIDKKIMKSIISNKEDLILDNYGKYILILSGIYKDEKNIDLIDNITKSIYNHLAWEYNKKTVKYIRNYMNENITNYNIFINKLLNMKNNSLNNDSLNIETIIEQLKQYVRNCMSESWDPAFNHFQNVFHELCKNKFKLKDDENINKVVDKLFSFNLIDSREEIILRKFYNRRNFNPVSHGSQNGKGAVKISKEAIKFFSEDILKLAIKICECELKK